MDTIKLWQTLTVRDADSFIEWLRAIGFRESATYRNDADPTRVDHAQWVWPGGGGLMFGSRREDSPVADAGPASTYLVCDDPARQFDAAVAAGGTVVDPMTPKDYGGSGGTVRDPEGNYWSFGDYQPQ